MTLDAGTRLGRYLGLLARRCLAALLTLAFAAGCSLDAGVPSLDGRYSPQTILIPDFRIEGKELVYSTGQKEVILSIDRGLFESVEPGTIKLKEYFLVHTNSSPFLLLTHLTRFVEVSFAGGEKGWVMDTSWTSQFVDEDEFDVSSIQFDEDGRVTVIQDGRETNFRFWKTSGPKRELSARHLGLVEVPVRSGRRIWVKK